MPALIILLFVVFFVIVLGAILLGFAFLQQRRKKSIAGTLTEQSFRTPTATDEVSVLQNPAGGNSLLGNEALAERLSELLQQSGSGWPMQQLLFGTAAAAVVGAFIGWRFPLLISPIPSMLVLAAIFSTLPIMIVRFKRKKRFAEIEAQFPEALDFLARSMRAGHAFTISLEMLGQEMPAPLGPEIRTLYNEHNLGAPLDVALNNLVKRVPLLDVRFFVSTVLLQRQTGGNLSEILLKLAHVMRERFIVRGQVKAASAHGRITAGILTAIPIVMAIGLMLTTPDYLKGFMEDPDGPWLIFAAIAAQVIGFFVIRKIVNIKV